MTYIFAGAFARFDQALAASLRCALPTAAIRRFTNTDVPNSIPHEFCPRTWAPAEGLLAIAWPTKYTAGTDDSLPDDFDGDDAFAIILNAARRASASHPSASIIALHVHCFEGRCGCTAHHLLAGQEHARQTFTPEHYHGGLNRVLTPIGVTLGPHTYFPPLHRGAFAELGESCDH